MAVTEDKKNVDIEGLESKLKAAYAKTKKNNKLVFRLRGEIKNMATNLLTDPPMTWSVLKAKLTPQAFETRSKLPNFVYDDLAFETTLGQCQEIPAYTYPNGAIYAG